MRARAGSMVHAGNSAHSPIWTSHAALWSPLVKARYWGVNVGQGTVTSIVATPNDTHPSSWSASRRWVVGYADE